VCEDESIIKLNTQGANWACENGDKEVVECFIGKEIRPDMLGANLGCFCGHKEVVEYLIKSWLGI
jgi:hypothetical protein